jgi:hypothetical protein
MLEHAEELGYSDIISWSPNGRSFKIHKDGTQCEEDEKAIVKVLKENFNQTRFKSFSRQLQLYRFERKFKGDHRGECRHPMLIRGQRDLLHRKSIEDFLDAAMTSSSANTATSTQVTCSLNKSALNVSISSVEKGKTSTTSNTLSSSASPPLESLFLKSESNVDSNSNYWMPSSCQASSLITGSADNNNNNNNKSESGNSIYRYGGVGTSNINIPTTLRNIFLTTDNNIGSKSDDFKSEYQYEYKGNGQSAITSCNNTSDVAAIDWSSFDTELEEPKNRLQQISDVAPVSFFDIATETQYDLRS